MNLFQKKQISFLYKYKRYKNNKNLQKMSQTKQAMQNTIKNLQAKSEYINKLEDKGSRALVLQLGSHTIKLGFANEKAPFVIRPFIAYKNKSGNGNGKNSQYVEQAKEGFDYESFKNEYQKLEQRLKIEGVVAQDNRTLKGKPRSKQIVTVDKVPSFRPDADTLYGQQALWVQKDPNYTFRKPLCHGFFNVPAEQENQESQPYKATVHDLQNIILYMLSEKLKIPSSQLGSFSCVIIVPDIFVRKHVKYFLQRMFHGIGWRKVYLHIESVLACFGAAVSSACVVDIGHEKISVCCVDEGVIMPQTLIRKNFGLKWLSKSLCKIFAQRISDKDIGQIRFTEQADLAQIDKVKQISTAIRDPDQSLNRVYQIPLIRKKSILPFQVSYSDSICVVSNSLFSQMWNSFQSPYTSLDQFNLHSQYFDLYSDPEDYFEEYSGGGHIYEINRSNNDQIQPELYDPWQYQAIDELILTSLNSIKDKDQRRRYYANLLVIGGGGQMQKLTEEIIAKINTRLGFVTEENQPQKVDLACDLLLRELQPVHVAWLGGTVIPKLDSLRDLWIEKGKFIGEMAEEDNEEDEESLDKKLFVRKEQSQVWGVAYLKEKVPFVW